IEGAEYDALKGAERIISEGKPGLILEQNASDLRCHEFLSQRGYIAVDLANYRKIGSAADFEESTPIANILFIHGENASGDPYINASAPVEVARLPAEAFQRNDNGSLSLKEMIELPPGRYVCKAHFTASGRDNEIFAGIDTDRGRIYRYHTYTQL